MGGFAQALTSGIGETGEAVGKAVQQNTEQGMQQADQEHKFTMDYLANQARNRQMDIATQGQTNEYNTQQAQLGIQRDALKAQGWHDLGPQRIVGTDGSVTWKHQFQNLATGAGMSIDIQPPLDSFESQKDKYNQLMKSDSGYKFTKEQAASIAFKDPALARMDPGALAQQYYQDAVNNPNLLKKGQTPRQYMQDLLDLQFERGAYAHWGPGASVVNGGNYGLTANEKREFDATTAPDKAQDAAVNSVYSTMMKTAEENLLPGQNPATDPTMMGLRAQWQQALSDPINHSNQTAQGIISRRNQPAAGAGQSFSKSQWLKSNPKGNVDAAVKQAQAAGMKVIE